MNRRFALVFALAAASSCARVSSPLSGNLGGAGDDADLAMPADDAPDLGDDASARDMAVSAQDLTLVSDLAAPHDLAIPRDLATPHDLAIPRDLTPPPDLRTPPDLVVVVNSCHLVINELQTETTQSASEEFVEIYNPCTTAVAVDGFKLGYRAATNTTPASSSDSSTLYTFSGSLAAGAYFVVAGTSFGGTKNGTLSSGLATSGSVALRDAAAAIVDSVAYGTVTAGNAFIETAAAPKPPSLASPGGSIQRTPNGTDNNDNSHDFTTTTAATPGAANH